jgi:heme/copper-type cytochrome/quinol oxidase subunit 2
MEKESILVLILLAVPLVSAFISPGNEAAEAELAQMNYNNGIFLIILTVALVLIAVVYYFLARKKNEKKRSKKENGKKRNP